MNTYTQAIIALAALIGVVAVSYNFFVLAPRQQVFENCISTYTSDWKTYIADKILVSAADFCEKEYDFSEFIRLGKAAREDARAQYANPDSFWIEDEVTEDTYKRVRAEIGIDY